MAEREEFSTQNIFDNIPTTVNEIEASALDAFFNDSDELEEIQEESETKPKKTPPTQQKKEQPKTPPKKEETVEEKEEESSDSIMDKMLGISEEEEETSTSEEEETQDENVSGEEETEENKFQELAKEFLDLGILTLNEDEEELNITSGEELASRLQIESKKSAALVVEKFLNRFGEDYKEAFDAIYVQGVNPKDYFQTVSEIEDLESMDLTLTDNQKKIFRQHYKSLGFDEDRIESKLQKAIDYGDLEDDVKDFHKVLVQKQKDQKEQLIAQQEQLNKKKAQQKQHYVHSVNQIIASKLQGKEFDGIPLDSNFAQETFSFLTEDRYQTPDGQTLTEFDRYLLDLKKPENYERKVKLAMLAQMIEKDPTLSKLQKKAITKETNKLFGKVIKHTEKQKTSLQKKIEDDKITSFI